MPIPRRNNYRFRGHNRAPESTWIAVGIASCRTGHEAAGTIGRTGGPISQWLEIMDDQKPRIECPRSNGMVENMRRLAIDPAEIEVIVLSHGHWDHVTGMEGLLRLLGSTRLPVMIHPEFWSR